MYCERLASYKGEKSNIIMEMIHRNETEKIKAKIGELSQDRQLKNLVMTEKVKEKELAKAKSARKKREQELKIEWDSYSRKYRVSAPCLVSKSVKVRLQKANDLFSLGKRSAAQKIWDKIISEHGLGEK